MSFHVMPRYLMRKNALKHLLKRLQKEFRRKDITVLEIGYGAGEIFNMYVELGLRPFGYDFSEKAQQTALQQPAVKNGNVVLYKSWDEIPSANFDVVIACEVMEHIEDDQQELAKWVRYLKPSQQSALIISVPAHPERWDNSDIVMGHYRRYTKQALHNLLNGCHMQIVALYTYDFPSNLILDPMRSSRLKDAARQDVCKEKRTKDSGVEREESRLIRLLASPLFWLPIIKLQQLFYRTDLGSAYILLAQGTQKEGQV